MPTWNLVSGYTNPDAFVRANGAVGNGWLQAAAIFSIVSNQLSASGAGTLYRPSSEGTQDQRVVYRFISNSTGYGQVYSRFDGSANGYVALSGSPGDPNLYINKLIGGTYTGLGAAVATSSFVAGKTYEIDLATTGVNPTTLAITVTNITDSVVMVSNAVRTDSTSTLQVSTGRPAIGCYSSAVIGVYSATYSSSLSLSPTSITKNSTGNTIALTRPGASWTVGTPGSPTFALTGGTGASITAQAVTSATSATITVSAGSTNGTLTITDPSTSETTTITVVNPPISPNNANIITSPYNSEFNGSSWVQSNNTGFYQRFTLTGVSYLYATFDVSALVAQGATSGQYPKVRAIIGDKLLYDAQLSSSTTEVLLASGLTGTPDVFVYYHASGDYTMNRWAASGNNSVRLVSYRTDGALTVPVVRTKKTIIFGDSITEGNAFGALESFAANLGLALNSDYGQVGFGSQGWNVAGSGSVPIFGSAWNLQRLGVSRSFTSQPDYVVIVQGVNDGINGVTDATVQANATSTLQAMRAAMPNAWIFVVVPFGQFKQSALSAAVTALNDRKIVLIDLGTDAARGITALALGASVYSVDGIHPTTFNNGRISALLAAAIQAKLATATRRSVKL